MLTDCGGEVLASQLSACYATELLSGTKMLPFLGQAFSLWQGKAAMRAEFIAPLAREKFDVMSRIRLCRYLLPKTEWRADLGSDAQNVWRLNPAADKNIVT